MRVAEISRNTNETIIEVAVALDGTGEAEIDTKSAFFNHMLEQLTCHSLMDIRLKARGDEDIDFHHMIEDSGYALGEAISKALGMRKGIARYGYAYAPMDESLARVVIDFSGRPCLVIKTGLDVEKIGDLDTELFAEFFQALSQGLGVSLHIESLYGANNHHKIEGIFKALAMALRMAIEIDDRKNMAIPSTKGTLSGVKGMQ